ncbi:hypothetical protein RB195_024877 [Necator americanus]|uniref:Reverse transcriptase domain-containing protein n=1 Tax=Necator americanus TaxID=51031 RepID=A0ABR1EPY3_NECAM
MGKRFAVTPMEAMMLPDYYQLPVECESEASAFDAFVNCTNRMICSCENMKAQQTLIAKKSMRSPSKERSIESNLLIGGTEYIINQPFEMSKLGRTPEATRIVLARAMWQICEDYRLEDGAGQRSDSYKLIYHGTSNRNGVGIILNESFRNSVTDVDRLSDRLMAVKVDTGEVELSGAVRPWNEDVQVAIREKKSDRYKAAYDMLDTREGEQAVYRLVRGRHRSTLDMKRTKIVKGADGVLRRSGQILERWREYYNHLCNEEFCHPPIPTVPSVEGPVLPITAVEVSAALAKMKSNKATGPDDIPADVWKLLGDRGRLANFRDRACHGKGKGDIADCTSCRPIRLLCHTIKVFERVLEARLRKIVSISLNQCGFVKDCSTIDAIHAVRILLEKHREKNRSVHLAFLDLEKAFDRVPHELLWMSMRLHRVPEEYVRWMKLLYAKPTSVVRCAAGTSRPFPVQVGVHQGSSLSPLLFILCLDTITKEIQKLHPRTLLFADDVMLASESRDDLQKLQYLGSKVTFAGDIDQECRARVNAAWMKWKMATGVLCDKKVPVRLKSKIYRTVVRPVALYGVRVLAADQS